MEIGPDRVIEEVARRYGVGREEIVRGVRGRENEARKVAMYLVRRYCDRTLPEIARYFDIENYSTVSWHCRAIESRMIQDKRIKDRLERIVTSIQQL